MIFFVGLVFLLLSLTLPTSSGSNLPLLIVAVIAIILGTILFLTVGIIMVSRYYSILERAIAEESVRYSTRSPIACTWGLVVNPNRVSYLRDIIHLFQLFISDSY